MLFRKKEEETKKPVENTEPYVCKACGCLVAQTRAHKVIKETYTFRYTTDYYCGSCAPAYDKHEFGWLKKSDDIFEVYDKYFMHIPDHYEEVTEKGKPLKKKK